MATHVEGSPARRVSSRAWATVGAVVVLLAAVGVGVLIGRATAEEPAAAPQPLGLASADVQTMLGGRMAALNSGDAQALAAFYAPDGILEERDQQPAVITKGSEEIASHLHEYFNLGFRLRSESVAVTWGPYVTEAATWSGGGGILVYQLDPDLKIVHQWVIGGAAW